MRVAKAFVAALGTALLALVLVWPFATGRWRGPLGDALATGDQTQVEGATDHDAGSTTTALPPPSITVAAAGRYGTEVLQGLEFAFFDLTGEAVDVVGLTSEFDVWKLAADTNRIDADVIEVGFRTDALSAVGELRTALSGELDPRTAQGMLLIQQICEQLLPHIEAGEVALGETLVIDVQRTPGVTRIG